MQTFLGGAFVLQIKIRRMVEAVDYSMVARMILLENTMLERLSKASGSGIVAEYKNAPFSRI